MSHLQPVNNIVNIIPSLYEYIFKIYFFMIHYITQEYQLKEEEKLGCESAGVRTSRHDWILLGDRRVWRGVISMMTAQY